MHLAAKAFIVFLIELILAHLTSHSMVSVIFGLVAMLMWLSDKSYLGHPYLLNESVKLEMC